MQTLQGKTVLVVDDEAELRELLCWEIQHRGGMTLEASSGQSASEILKFNAVDGVITDVRMPNGDGVQLLEKIRDHHPDLPIVILISGHADSAASHLFAKGAEAFFVKPFAIVGLIDKLEALLQPRAIRWKQRLPRVPTANDIEVVVDSEWGDGKVVNIGRGGMFIASNEQLPPVGKNISFKLTFQKPHVVDIEGTAVVRWVRAATQGSQAGCGVEFMELSDQSLAFLVNQIEGSLSKCFIPER